MKFDDSLVRFLAQLKKNNNRAWFAANRTRYEAQVREPVLAFIRAIAPRIEAISRHIYVSDAKVGGSMMRPYRDTRFSPSKLPYKTNVGIQFRHERGEDAHAPGFWINIEPGEFWLAAGIWRPDGATTDKVRQAIVESGDDWLAARDDAGFRAQWSIVGDSLQRPPRGYDATHPLIVDLKRKEWLGLRDAGIESLYRSDLIDFVSSAFAATTPLMRFLCEALGMRF